MSPPLTDFQVVIEAQEVIGAPVVTKEVLVSGVPGMGKGQVVDEL